MVKAKNKTNVKKTEAKNIGTLTCPKCQGKTKMEIPEGRCIPSFVCSSCKETIWAKNQCCVFCDYADKKCPVGH